MFPNSGYQNPYGMMNQAYPQQFQPMIPQRDESPKTLWVGGIDSSFTEQTMRNLFKNDLIYIANIKMIKDKNFCFLEFTTHEAAKSVLARYNGQPFGPQYPGKFFRLNWGSFSVGDGKRTVQSQENSTNYNLFVGDLAPEIDDFTLFRAFQQKYKSVQSGKIMMDPKTGQPKGYGFVRFGDENEAMKCMEEMQGVFLGSRQIKIAPASQKSAPSASKPSSSPYNAQSIQQQQQQMQQQQQQEQKQQYQAAQQLSDEDPNLSQLYIGGLSENISEMQLRAAFEPFGTVTSVRLLPQKKCGFVEFQSKNEAVNAKNAMNGQRICGDTVKVSWGKVSPNKSKVGPSQQPTPMKQQPVAPSKPTVQNPSSYAIWQQMYSQQSVAGAQFQVQLQQPPKEPEYVGLGTEESTNTFDLMKENEKFMMKNPITFVSILDDEAF